MGGNRVPKCPGQAGGFRTPNSPAAGPECQAFYSWAWGLEQVSSLAAAPSSLKWGGAITTCKVMVLLVRPQDRPGTEVPKKGELDPPPVLFSAGNEELTASSPGSLYSSALQTPEVGDGGRDRFPGL